MNEYKDIKYKALKRQLLQQQWKPPQRGFES